MENYDLLVVGNGFDLHLGLPTSYEKFLNWYAYNKPEKNSLLTYFEIANNSNIFETTEWNSFEKNLCILVEFIHYVCNPKNITIKYQRNERGFHDTYSATLILRCDDNFPSYFLRFLSCYNPFEDFAKISWFNAKGESYNITSKSCRDQNVVSFEIKMYCEYFNKPLLSEIEDYLIKQFDQTLSRVELILSRYIKRFTDVELKRTAFLESVFAATIPYLISFNYSLTATRLFQIKEGGVAFVHGNINSVVVLGIEEKMWDYQTVEENTKYNRFFKRSRRIIKECNRDFNKKILDKIPSNAKLAVFGHSLDLSDRSIFQKVFDCEFDHCDIYCYGDISEYRSKLVRLIGIDKAEQLFNDGKIEFLNILP